MRKSIWLIPVVFLLTAMGCPKVSADTLQFNSSGYVNGITGVNIGGALYTVTFGSSDIYTSASQADAVSLGAEIASDLGDNLINTGATFDAGDLQSICVDAGGGTCQRYNDDNGVWVAGGGSCGAGCATDGNFQAIVGGTAFWADFVATPEPGTAPLLLTGLLGLILVMRKRIAPGLPRAS